MLGQTVIKQTYCCTCHLYVGWNHLSRISSACQQGYCSVRKGRGRMCLLCQCHEAQYSKTQASQHSTFYSLNSRLRDISTDTQKRPRYFNKTSCTTVLNKLSTCWQPTDLGKNWQKRMVPELLPPFTFLVWHIKRAWLGKVKALPKNLLLKSPTRKENLTAIENRGPEKAWTVLPMLHRTLF